MNAPQPQSPGIAPDQPAQVKPGPASLIRMLDVVKMYPGLSGTVTALKGIRLEIGRGEFVAIMGRSGSGKTSLVNLLAGMDRVTAGEIWVGDQPVHRFREEQAAHWRGRNVGFIFQAFHLVPTLTVLQNVTLPMDFAGYGSLRQRRERGLALLEDVGIKEHAFKLPAQVSGGQQQRIAIARSLANDPTLIVADEPTGSLDSKTALTVFDIFRTLADQGKTVVVVTHDRELAQQAGRTIQIFDGEIHESTEAAHA